MARQADSRQLSRGRVVPKDEGDVNQRKCTAIKDWLEGQDEEIANAMLVSTLIFTVAAAAILQPHEANLQGEHTDLFGSLCVMSVMFNLFSVLTGTVTKRTLRYTTLHYTKNIDHAMKFVQDGRVKFFLLWPTLGMWLGAVTMTLALMI